MNLNQEEKNKLISAKDEKEWYSICDEIKARRNGIYPNYLARDILAIYENKFPVDKYPEIEALREKMMNRKAFLTWLSVGWLAFAAATGGFFTAMIRFLFPNVLFEPPQSFKIGFPDDFESGKVDLRFKKDLVSIMHVKNIFIYSIFFILFLIFANIYYNYFNLVT